MNEPELFERIKELLAQCDFPQNKRGYNYLDLPKELRYLQVDQRKKARPVDERLQAMGFPTNLSGKKVLDLGCNIGSFTIEALKRGAVQADGYEVAPPCVECMKLMLEYYGYTDRGSINEGLLTADTFDALAEEKYDYVLALSIVGHLKSARKAFWSFLGSVREKIFFEGHAKKTAEHYLKQIPSEVLDQFSIVDQFETVDRSRRCFLVFERKS